jgi:intein/homing endonuclease
VVEVKDHDVIQGGKIIATGVEYTLTMEQLTEKYNEAKESGNIKLMPLAKSKNLDTGEVEYKQVMWAAQTKKDTEVMRITDEGTGKTVTCTPDHQIWTKNRGWVEAQNLKEDDELDFS